MKVSAIITLKKDVLDPQGKVIHQTLDGMGFKDINEVGKQWIKKYGLALCKELLGTIRSKYASLPIPNAETTLDGDTLRTEASTEKEARNLVTHLNLHIEWCNNPDGIEVQDESTKLGTTIMDNV